jgi:CheY-like chemotaxis protein
MKHVVLVEDDPVNATLFRKLLERRGGYHVTVTESPEEILRLARDGSVDLVLLDVSLDNSFLNGQAVGGIEICKLLKADRQTAGVPVLLVTAHAMRGDEQRLIAQSGAEGYVSKPVVDHEQFLARIRAHLPAEAA